MEETKRIRLTRDKKAEIAMLALAYWEKGEREITADGRKHAAFKGEYLEQIVFQVIERRYGADRAECISRDQLEELYKWAYSEYRISSIFAIKKGA